MNVPSGTRLAAWMPSRIFPDCFTLYLALLAVLGAVLVLARQITYGVVLSRDAVQYVAAARSLLAGEGFIDPSGEIYFAWPPLYPLLLAAASLGVFDPLDMAGPLNAAIFGLTIFIAGRWLRQYLHSRFLAVWACLVLALSLPLADLASQAMSDPAFILLTILALIQADRFLAEERSSSLIRAGVFTALAWQTRHIGAAVPIFIGFLLLFQTRTPFPQRVKRIAVFSSIAAAPMGLWLLRTYLLTGRFVYRMPADYPLSQALSDTGRHLRTWADFDLSLSNWPSLEFLPPDAVFAASALAAALILAGCAVFRDRRKDRQTRFGWRPVIVFGGFALAYPALLFWAAVRGNTDFGIQSRYVAPLYIPFLIAASCTFDRFFLYARERKLPGGVGGAPIPGRWSGGSLPATLVMAALSLWAAGQVVPHVHEIGRANGPNAPGYGGRIWADSETLRHIREHPLSGRVYSNNAAALIYLYSEATKQAAAYLSLPTTHADGYRVAEEQRTTGKRQLETWLAGAPDGAWVVWLNNWTDNRLFDYGPVRMRITPGLEMVEELADGFIFKVNRGHRPRSSSYRPTYESIVSMISSSGSELLFRSSFDVWFDGIKLTYVKMPCVRQDTEARFSLHIFPSDMADLPPERVQYGFDNLDFGFSQYGEIIEETCLMTVTLPGYGIDRIGTGQLVGGGGGGGGISGE